MPGRAGGSDKPRCREAILATLDRWEKEYAADPQRFVHEFEMMRIFENIPLTNPDALAPLMIAAVQASVDVARLLLQHGAK